MQALPLLLPECCGHVAVVEAVLSFVSVAAPRLKIKMPSVYSTFLVKYYKNPCYVGKILSHSLSILHNDG